MNVPHTDDVKETFGSMIDTVVEQEAEIKVINNNLETVVEDTGETYEEKMILMLRRMRMDDDDDDIDEEEEEMVMVMMMMILMMRR